MALPELDYTRSKPTIEMLHLFLQIIGKIKLSLMPRMSNLAHLPLQLSARGLTTGLMPGGVEIRVDLLQQVARVVATNGRVRVVSLENQDTRGFYDAMSLAMEEIGSPVETEDAPPSGGEATQDPRITRRIFRAWAAVHQVLLSFRADFGGQCSDVALDWTTMNLGVTLYSGRPAKAPGDIEGVEEEALSSEQFSCGFSLGDELSREPSFYAWMHPAVSEISHELRPSGAVWNTERSRAQLVYRALAPRTDWPVALGLFFESAYEAQAKSAGWEIERLRGTT
jgi:hypothetical protein